MATIAILAYSYLQSLNGPDGLLAPPYYFHALVALSTEVKGESMEQTSSAPIELYTFT